MLLGEVVQELRSAADAAGLCKFLLSGISEQERDREIMIVLLLDQTRKTFRQEIVSMGSEWGTVAYPKQVFRSAIQWGASYVVLLHTHQTGNLEPSDEDWELTQGLIKAGILLDVPVLDHIVLSGHEFVSLRERRWSEWC
jgi:DNA repair protein RadC